MQLPPFDVVLTWPAANYTNPSEERGPAILILTVTFVPLLVIIVALRTYTRLRLSKNFGADDVAILLAVLPTMACAVLTLTAVRHYGWSRHVWDVPSDQLEVGLKYEIAVEVLFCIACSLTKLSMLLLILRVLAAGSMVLRRLSITVMVIVFLESVVFSIVVVNTCSPVSLYWTLSFAPQQCINETAHLLAGGIINTLTDFCVVLIPIPVVMRLKLPLKQRIYCALLFGAGFVICIAGSFRIAYVYLLNTTYDKTWLAYPAWISGTVELYLGIIATSIPAIKPLISRHFPGILSSSDTKNGQYSTSGHLRSLEPHRDRSSVKSPDSDHSHTPIIINSSTNNNTTKPVPFTLDIEKGIASLPPSSSSFPQKIKSTTTSALSSPLTPVVSAFSTYKKNAAAARESRKSVREKGISLPVAAWKNEQPLLPSSSSRDGGGGGGGGARPVAGTGVAAAVAATRAVAVAKQSSESSLDDVDGAWGGVRREDSREELVAKGSARGEKGDGSGGGGGKGF